MRALLSKALTGSMIAGAALLVSACGGSTNTTTENTVVTDLNATDATMDAGTMTDNMTAVDGAMGDNSMMPMDDMNSSMEMNSMSMNTTTTTTNAM